jgi:hypothetical protein
MSVPYDFEKTLTEKTDEELSDMLAHEVDYLPEALVAVRLESQRRNLSPAQIAQLDMQSQAILAQEGQAARQPLSWAVKLIMFLLSFGIIQAVVAESYRNKGYSRKHDECWTWMWYGVGFWIVFWTTLYASFRIADNFSEDVSGTTAAILAVVSATFGVLTAVVIARLRRRRSGEDALR